MVKLTREQVAWRAAQDLREGAYVNLGIGIPTLAASFVPKDREVIFHSENGILGLGPRPAPGMEDPNLIDAGKNLATWPLAVLLLILHSRSCSICVGTSPVIRFGRF